MTVDSRRMFTGVVHDISELQKSQAAVRQLAEIIEESVNDGTPFFAYMTHFAVHSPFQDDPRFTANYPTLSGNARVTVQNLKVAGILEGQDVLLIKGAIPGPNGGYVVVRKALKKG